MISDFSLRTYRQLEDSKRTEFNQQFLNYNGKTDLTVQDIVTIINLAKDSNKKNQLQASDAPSNPLNDFSYYVTVEFKNSSYNLGGTNPASNELSNAQRKNLENLDSNKVNSIINTEMSKDIIATFSCKVVENKNTKYVNYIEIN